MAYKDGDKDLECFMRFSDPATPSKLEKVARDELGETEELRTECLEKLRTMITDNGVICIMTDDFLLRFLRHKKFRIKKCFEVIQNYAKMRVSNHERIMKLSPEVVKRCLDLHILGFLPFRDQEERAIFYDIPEKWDPSIFSLEEYVMCYVLMLSYITEKQETQVNGFVSIYYDSCAPMSTLISLMPHFPFLLKFLFECLPARYPKAHMMSESLFFRTAMTLVDPFLPKKIKERVIFQGTSGEELSKHISPTILPDEFGGTLGPLNNDHITEEVISFLLKMQDDQKYFIHED